jgi:hypothetical protein
MAQCHIFKEDIPILYSVKIKDSTHLSLPIYAGSQQKKQEFAREAKAMVVYFSEVHNVRFPTNGVLEHPCNHANQSNVAQAGNTRKESEDELLHLLSPRWNKSYVSIHKSIKESDVGATYEDESASPPDSVL